MTAVVPREVARVLALDSYVRAMVLHELPPDDGGQLGALLDGAWTDEQQERCERALSGMTRDESSLLHGFARGAAGFARKNALVRGVAKCRHAVPAAARLCAHRVDVRSLRHAERIAVLEYAARTDDVHVLRFALGGGGGGGGGAWWNAAEAALMARAVCVNAQSGGWRVTRHICSTPLSSTERFQVWGLRHPASSRHTPRVAAWHFDAAVACVDNAAALRELLQPPLRELGTLWTHSGVWARPTHASLVRALETTRNDAVAQLLFDAVADPFAVYPLHALGAHRSLCARLVQQRDGGQLSFEECAELWFCGDDRRRREIARYFLCNGGGGGGGGGASIVPMQWTDVHMVCFASSLDDEQLREVFWRALPEQQAVTELLRAMALGMITPTDALLRRCAATVAPLPQIPVHLADLTAMREHFDREMIWAMLCVRGDDERVVQYWSAHTLAQCAELGLDARWAFDITAQAGIERSVTLHVFDVAMSQLLDALPPDAPLRQWTDAWLLAAGGSAWVFACTELASRCGFIIAPDAAAACQ